MSYNRSRIIERTVYNFDGTHYRAKYGQSLWNVQKKVNGHYLTALDRALAWNELLYYSGSYVITEPSDQHPQYATSYPTDVDTYVPGEMDTIGSPDLDRCTNKAYAKFTDSMKDTAQNANNALEAGQALSQIGKHVASLAGAIHNIRHGDIGGAAKSLGISISGSTEQKIKRRGKQAADRWLELHFGWAPLVQDIGSSIDILQGTGKSSPYSFHHIKSSASNSGGTHSGHTSIVPGPYLDSTNESYSWDVGCRMGGVVAVENPNIAIANQMGFVNPLSVAWEAVPFSFVADWFSNAGQCISAMSDFWGFQLHQGWTATKYQCTFSYSSSRDGIGPGSHHMRDEAYSIKRFKLGRAGGLTSPVFRFTPFKGFSLERGATAISLLVQQMKGL
jgi:hypothetical protein